MRKKFVWIVAMITLLLVFASFVGCGTTSEKNSGK